MNFVDSLFLVRFYEEMNGKKWECFNSEKVCEITYARIQGKQKLVEHFEGNGERRVKPLVISVA